MSQPSNYSDLLAGKARPVPNRTVNLAIEMIQSHPERHHSVTSLARAAQVLPVVTAEVAAAAPTANGAPEDVFKPDPSAPRELLLELASYWHTRYVLERDLVRKQQAAKSAAAAEAAAQAKEDS